MRTLFASAWFVGTLTTGLAAQTVHLVGPGGFATIQQAVDAAAPDDIVHVQAGTYFSFTVQKSLRIRALGTVTLGTSVIEPGHVVVQAPAGATVDFVGFNMMTLQVHSGRASLDACTVRNGTGVQNASLHLQSCTLLGGTALLAQNADVTAVQSGFYSPAPFLAPGPLIDLVGSRLHASACQTRDGGLFQQVHLYIRASNGSRVWWADGYIGWTPAGHCPLDVSADSQVRTDRTSFSTIAGCPVPTPGTLLGVQTNAPLRVGMAFQPTFRTDPGAFVVVFASPFLGTTDFGPLLEQPSWLDDQYSFAVALQVADAAGQASFSFPIPAGPGIANRTLWLKGISGLGLPLQVSPPVGGVAR